MGTSAANLEINTPINPVNLKLTKVVNRKKPLTIQSTATQKSQESSSHAKLGSFHPKKPNGRWPTTMPPLVSKGDRSPRAHRGGAGGASWVQSEELGNSPQSS